MRAQEAQKVPEGQAHREHYRHLDLFACRNETVPRTIKEISALTTVSEKEIGKCFQKMEKMEKNAAIEATDLLPRFCFHLGLSNDILRATTSLCVVIKNLGIAASKTPNTVAAAAIYLVTQISNNPKSPKVCGVHQRFLCCLLYRCLFLLSCFLEVARVAGVVTKMTLKNTYKDLYEKGKELVPDNFAVNPKSADKKEKEKGPENFVDLYEQLPEP